MKRKILILIGLFALLESTNIQVKALNPAKNIVVTHDNTREALDEWMPDKNLQEAMVKAMHLKNKLELTQEALSKYEDALILSNYTGNIKNIKGLEYATSTYYINVENNLISDLSPLSKLTQPQFRILILSNNKISNIASLTSLENLKTLYLDGQTIEDINPLSHMKKLTGLHLEENQIRDLTPLSKLKNLNYLIINNNKISDLSPLSDMKKLNELNAINQTITNKEITGYVGHKIGQVSNVIDINNNKIDLVPISAGGKYDPALKTINWGPYYDKGDKEVKSTFNIRLNSDSAFSGTVTQPIMVKFGQISMTVKNSTLYLGDKWDPKDNFISAIDEDGNSVGIDKIVVEGSANTSKEGTYKVAYKLKYMIVYVYITVKKDQTSVEVKDSRLYLHDKWKPEDNFVKAINKDGNDININDVIVEGNVNTNKNGISRVTYTILNHTGAKVSKEAIITVQAKKNGNEKYPVDKDKLYKSGYDSSKTTYTIFNNADKEVSKKAIMVPFKGNDNEHVKDKQHSKNKLLKNEYDVSFIIYLIGIAVILGLGKLYLNRRR